MTKKALQVIAQNTIGIFMKNSLLHLQLHSENWWKYFSIDLSKEFPIETYSKLIEREFDPRDGFYNFKQISKQQALAELEKLSGEKGLNPRCILQTIVLLKLVDDRV